MTVPAGTGAQDPPEESCSRWEMAPQLCQLQTVHCQVTKFLRRLSQVSVLTPVPWHRYHLLPQLGLTEKSSAQLFNPPKSQWEGFSLPGEQGPAAAAGLQG